MKAVIEKILKKNGKLGEFQTQSTFHFRAKSQGFMDLVIEKHGANMVSVSHYFEQNGDLIPDPDIQFYVDAQGEWHPWNITMSSGYYAPCLLIEGGVVKGKYPRSYKETKSFAAMWARNLKAQGFC